MANTLTLIEPHQHYEVLLRWVTVCSHLNWKIYVFSSNQNWNAINDLVPEACNRCQFKEIGKTVQLPSSDLIVFISVQTNWSKWMTIAKGMKSALIIHNGNFYLNPVNSVVKYSDTRFGWLKFTLKYMYEYVAARRKRNKFLKCQDYIFPFSNTQIDFLREHLQERFKPIIVTFKATNLVDKLDQVILNVHKRIHQVNWSYLDKCMDKYNALVDCKVIVIGTRNEYDVIIKRYKCDEIIFKKYPLTTIDYHNLLAISKYYCYPFNKKYVFDIFLEELGHTKYSGRIRDAVEYGCIVDLPNDILLEEHIKLVSLEQIVEVMKKSLSDLIE